MIDTEQRIEKIRSILGSDPVPIFVAKNSRVNGDFLTMLEQSLSARRDQITRQRLRISGYSVTAVRNSDVVKRVLMEGGVGFTTIDALLESGGIKMCHDLEISTLGTGVCTVEVACDPNRTDLIDVFTNYGIRKLRQTVTDKGITVASDVPKIARLLLKSEIDAWSGSLETLDKNISPVIVGVVETGRSLTEEGWLRLSQTDSKYAQEAILLRSQTCVIRKKIRPI